MKSTQFSQIANLAEGNSNKFLTRSLLLEHFKQNLGQVDVNESLVLAAERLRVGYFTRARTSYDEYHRRRYDHSFARRRGALVKP